ncbi:Holliday junction resolvase RuvX [Micromonospora sp. RTP1Z1]|uniref:Holliday junction resolvase RuvX n=1 Tax=Micromonospora sp. RTP1Z1 TaxID=2994043 RepID=UPI0029C72F77|nr:Holliday junction resolvase RuvX [Micromonospora sp. RTP1Z1]
MAELSRGVRLGVDVGQVRVGVSRSDPHGILATPLVTLARDLTAADDAVPAEMAALVDLIAEYEAVEVVMGLPVNLAGKLGPAATNVSSYAARLADVIAPVPVTLTDERMSTVVASRRLAERGVRGKRQRAVVDQAAAVEILQSWLDAQRRRTQ